MKKLLIPIIILCFGVLSLGLLLTLDDNKSRESTLPLLRTFQKEFKQIERLINRLFPVSPEKERDFGKKIFAKFVYKKTGKSRYQDAIEPIAQTYNQPSPLIKRFPRKYFFKVIPKRPEANAFALPGGFVCILEGMVKKFSIKESTPSVKPELTNPDALAYVMAHEIGHVELQHCADHIRYRVLFKKMKVPVGGELMTFLRNIASLSYSETQEIEADNFALRLMKDKGYRLEGAVECAEAIIKGKEKKGPHAKPGEILDEVLGDYIRTHPGRHERINRLKEAIRKLQK